MKKICIMFTGQMRTNGLSNNSEDHTILNSVKKYIINENLKNNYEYDVFISTDEIDINKAREYFGNNLKNINITESYHYINHILQEVESFDYFYNKLIDTTKNFSYNLHTNSFYQNYRIYCCYKMVIDYEEKNNFKYDFYIKVRLDCRIMQDIAQLLILLDNSKKKLCMEHDHLIIARNEYSEVFNFINFIGTFQNPIDNSNGLFSYFSRNASIDFCSDDNIFFFCPERQMLEYVKYLSNKNSDMIADIFFGITYPSFQLIFRGDNNYGYSNYTDNDVYEPCHSIDYIKKFI